MVQKAASAPRGRLKTERMLLRRRRIFARLREGWSYGEIAAEEGVTITWVRQIVADVLEKRSVDSGAEHAKLQLERLAPAMQLAADAISAGDVSAIPSYLKVLDRLDRYQTVAAANQVYDEEARAKLLAKINRVAANLGIDEVMYAAGREHLRKIGEIRDKPGENQGEGLAAGAGDGPAAEAAQHAEPGA